jgi:Large polyvalent protein associated domain 29
MTDVASLGREYSQGKDWLTCAETAKLVRLALKRSFPGQKFSVRSSTYSGGASITVSWTDGPNSKSVDEVVRAFNGADFDGMVDLKTYNTHWLLPDGSVTVASAGGQGSTRPEYLASPPSPNARLVSLGANFVFTQRDVTEEFKRSLIPEFEKEYGKPYDPSERYYVRGGYHEGELGERALYYFAHTRSAS